MVCGRRWGREEEEEERRKKSGRRRRKCIKSQFYEYYYQDIGTVLRSVNSYTDDMWVYHKRAHMSVNGGERGA